MNILDVFPDKDPRTASRIEDGEAVVVLLEQAEVKVLNPVGSRIWELCDGSIAVRDIIDRICEEYDVEKNQARQDATEFIQLLADHQMLVLHERPQTDETG